MGNADEYRANAEHCLQMASKAFTAEDAQSWFNMAETWFGMIQRDSERRAKSSKGLFNPSDGTGFVQGATLNGLAANFGVAV